MNVIKLTSDLKKNNSMFWVEANKIKLFVADDFNDRNGMIDTIREYKPEIIDFLVSNEIFSKEDFQKKTIFRSQGNEALLSFAQKRLWFIEQYEQGSYAYHIPLVMELNADTDIAGIKYAFQQIVSRHEVLRSTIEPGDGEEHGIQRVHDEPLHFDEVTVTGKQDFKALIEKDITRPFDLSTEYPIRVTFYTIQSTASETVGPPHQIMLLINFHHIASDGWSIDIFQKEWAAYYEAYIDNDTDFSLPTLEIQYKDYAAWQKAYLTGDILEKQLGYWKNKLSSYQTLELPTDYARPAEINYSGASQRFIVNGGTTQQLKVLAQRYGTTLYSVMLGGLNILLGKYTGQEDIITGSVIANRHHRQTEGLIGFFANTQVNRTLLSSTQTFAELIQQVHQEQVQAQLHQDLPFEKLVDELQVERDLSRHPLFQVMFGMQALGDADNAIDEKEIYPRSLQAEVAYEVEKFDLSIDLDDSRQEIMGQISYATALFHKDTIERLATHYIYLLEQLAEAPEQPYSQHSLLSPSAYNQIVFEWNATDKQYPENKTICQLFEEQAAKTPLNIALIYEQQQITYQQLNEMSNQLAQHIRRHYQSRTKQPLAPDTLIALYLDRSPETIIGILAVLKAGGAYVPIDITYPQERIDYMLQDTRAQLILSQRQLADNNNVQLAEDKTIYIDLTAALYKEAERSNLQQYSKATDLAYVIYTSGTTGMPKGVAIEHKPVVNMAVSRIAEYEMTEKENSLQIASICFDASVEQIFVALFSGATLTLIKKDVLIDSEKCELFFNEHKITHLDTVPSFLETLNFSKLKSLKRIASGGELCTAELVNRILPYIEFYNEYGPTEATVITTQYKIEKGKKVSETIPIGKPIHNTRVFILDKYLQVVPAGIVGEIYIGGECLARGYLNRDTLTAEKFVKNPFGEGRLYKTGDLGRWRNDGQIEYTGREDNQVKLRGFRIELSEVEYALSQITGIRQCCVLVKERKTVSGSNKYLVGYYVLDNSYAALSQATITDKLSQILPGYMVPAALVAMESFPLTITGKFDKKALPDPNFHAVAEEYLAPKNETEAAICNIWQKALGLDQVGISDNFFRIGGNSILAIQVSHKMSRALGCDIKVADVFKYKTISQLLHQSIGQTQTHIPAGNSTQSILSFAQERLWFIEQYEQGSNAYHIPAVYQLDASTDIAGIKYALQQIVSRHEVLRSTVEHSDTEEHTIQRVHTEPLYFEEVTVTGKEDAESLMAQDISRPFDLSAEYPIRVTFYHTQSAENGVGHVNKTLFLINIHHIASDGWSADVFEKELYSYYEAYINDDTDFSLPTLEIQYKDYAAWQRNYLTGDILEKQLSYWKEKLTGYQLLELPADYKRPEAIDYSGASIVFSLSEETTQKLRTLAQRYEVTLYSVMLSSLNILLSKYTGQEDIMTGSVIANRHHRQTEELIGLFANTQVNRTLLSSTQTFEELIQQVHQEQVQAQLHQDLPFEKLVDELHVERDLSRHPLFQVMFGMQNIINQENTGVEQKNYLLPFQFEGEYEVEKFDLSIVIYENPVELLGQISYATALFHKDTIERLATHYIYLLEQLAEAPEQPYGQHSLLSPSAYNQIVFEWNATDKQYPENKTICQLFEEQAAKTPLNIALIYEQQQITYQQLNEMSNQLAQHIRRHYQLRTKQPLAPDTLIALYLDRSPETIIGILAVLKAGGAYVPIDITYPQERIDYMLQDTRAQLILSQRQLADNNNVQLAEDKTIYIDLTAALYKEAETSSLQQYSKATDLAYVIYTSGTTGMPKGVMVQQAAIISLIYNDYIRLFDKDVFLFLSSPVFDASTFEIWAPLLNGNTLVIPRDIKDLTSDIPEFSNFLSQHSISVLWLTKTLFETLFHFKNDLFKDLHYLIIGGEALDRHIVEKLVSSHRKPKHFLNGYGPTESTTFTCMYDLGNGVTSSNVPIGRPIKNRNTYVLGPHLKPVPVGIIGELYIGGAGLARGYLNSPQLTAERFIANPFATNADIAKGYTRLYKTGDLVRWLADGNIEYMGRNDDQVKIRGYRIELGEIEYALSQITGIKQSRVLVKERKTASGNHKYLVGYYVSDPIQPALSQTSITTHLSQVLPDYMVPGILVKMEAFPLTINGKLDKRALPDPDFSEEENYTKPGTELESRLCEIYAGVLGLADGQISTHQSFFKMGGNSILSIQLKAKLNRLDEFKHTSIADLFKYNSIHKLIQSIQKDAPTQYQQHKNNTVSNGHEVAIIGVSGAFSGAATIAELWQLISNQLEGIQFYSKEECNALGMDDHLVEDPDYIAVEGVVEGIELFDPSFWEMSPNEARLLDPQIRKFMEHCWFVLEAAGYAQHRRACNIGVFAGSGSSSYFYDHILHGEMADQVNIWEASTSNSKDALATKTAYLLDLSGPANSINTACSTGLVTVVEACKNLQLGTCNMALAGGVSLSMPYQIGYMYQEGMILSKDGHCKTFDKDASGTTSGSGVGVVLLKRLADAIRDKDNIIGVIKGYATNNDGGRKTGYTAPSLIGQSECIINAQKMAGISPYELDYVECHGTGTHLGDPIEVQALREAFEFNKAGGNHLPHTTVLGAVKANIGHTDSAAGTAGLIKVVAMLQHQMIPGQVNYKEPNPELQLDKTSFEILTTNRPWPASRDKQRLAGVSSFGVGGTNAHVIIGDYIHNEQDRDEINKINAHSANGKERQLQYIIPLSAKSRQSLEHYKQALIEYLTHTKESNEALNIQDITYTLQERREHFHFRTAYSVTNIDELINEIIQDTSFAQIANDGGNKIVFMFPGQGSQYGHMAKSLYNDEPFFSNTINRLITIANQHLCANLHEVMYPSEESAFDINETQWSQISLFIIEYALADYLQHLGVQADAYIGHSIGEYVAAVLSGLFTIEDAIKLVIARGTLMQSMQPGSMLAVKAGEETLKAIVKKYNCEIAVINSAEDTVVSGDDKDIKALKKVLDNQGTATVILNTSHAYHSKMMEQAATDFFHVFQHIKLNKPVKDFISNVTGEIAGEEVTTAAYWCKQIRYPVQFAKGINTLSRLYHHQISFVEVGTGKGLSSFVNKYKSKHSYQSIQTVQLLPSAKEADAVGSEKNITAILWMNGISENPNNTALFAHAKLQTGLPVYQFNYQKCWIEMSERKDVIKFNSADEMFYERSWERSDIKTAQPGNEHIKQQHILILINDRDAAQNESRRLLNLISSQSDHVSYAIHQQANNIKADTIFNFDQAADIGIIFSEKAKSRPIDLVIYISPGIDMNNTCLDIFAVRNIFDWSKKTGNKIAQFISVSFDNFEVIGTEEVSSKPSVIYGVTKSIPFEYFSSGTKTIHIDLSLQDKGYTCLLPVALQDNEKRDLIVIRGKYQWHPTYRQIKFPETLLQERPHLISGGTTFLITGGLGALGYAYANHLTQREEISTIIIIGRTVEPKLRKDYKDRLAGLRMTGHRIIYAVIDIGDQDALSDLQKILAANHIRTLEVVLHAAGVAAKSALHEKTHDDVAQVMSPKVTGTETLIHLSEFVQINNLVCCSSVASIIPSLGNMEYTAANLYVDEIIHRNYPGINYMVALNLNQISDAGMAVDFIENSTSREGRSSDSISSQEFPGIVEMLLQTKTLKNIVLARYDFNTAFSNNFGILASLDEDSANGENIAIKIAEDSYTETEYKVAQIFADILGIEEISLHDDFFRIGGNSISAIQVSHRMSNFLGYDIRVADIFKYKNISQLLVHSIGQTLTDIPRQHTNRSVLSFSQERLWFIEQYEQGSNAYHIPLIYQLDAGTDTEGMKYALQQIVSRHEVLRSTIEQGEIEKYGIQQVHEEPLYFEEVILTGKEGFENIIEEDINHPFNLSVDYPIRVKFYRIPSDDAGPGPQVYKTVLLVNTHHIASDGWSVNIFDRELFMYYDAYINNDPNFNLPALEIQYKDYAAWQRNYLTGDILEKQLSYWKEKLSGYQPLELPADYTRPEAIDYSGATLVFSLSEGTTQKLRTLAQLHGVTLYSVMLSSLNILLSKYTGQEDIMTGSVIANRHLRQTEDLIGFFSNTQVNRTLLNHLQSFEELIQQVQQEQVQAQLYQDLPFEKLVDELGVERDPSRHPVFQVMFGIQNIANHENAGDDNSIDAQKIYLSPFEATDVYEVAKFDLSINILNSPKELSGQVNYATALFRKDTIERFINHYTHLLDQLAAAPEQPYSQFSLLSTQEYNQIVTDWNSTDYNYPKEKTIHQLFEEQATKMPYNIALVYEGQQLNYQQLNEKANQLARHINTRYYKKTGKELAPDTLVALYLGRSPEMIIAILAILKAGGAYVPIDITYPQERTNYILQDTGAQIILSQRQLATINNVQLPKDNLIYIDLSEEFYDTIDSTNLPQHCWAMNLAYVIYTSGTTGQPKGVMIQHSAVVSLVFNDFISLSAGDVFTFLSAPVFDAATFEIWMPLLNGNTLIIPGDLKQLLSNIDAFKAFIIFNQVSVLWLTKTLFESLYYADKRIFADLHYLITGGETLDKKTINQIVNSPVRPRHLLNAYGPTESTTFTCMYPLNLPIVSSHVPIGAPIRNRLTYVLGKDLLPVPIGVTGELYIGGGGLARGYLNNPHLTAQRFITNPFAAETDESNARLYRTGDLVRWLADGNLQFMGRNDNQVKIRGFRIELGEVEHALSMMAGIKQNCVLAKERKTAAGSDKFLVAYYILENSNDTLTQSAIIKFLSQVLPDYMVPGAYVQLASMPFTINGKLDRQALPDPDLSSPQETYVAPTNEREAAVCSIWQELLGLKRVGITDNFFRIGGNSILAIQVSHRMSRTLGCDVFVADVFKLKTIQVLLDNVSVKQVNPDNVEWDVLINM